MKPKTISCCRRSGHWCKDHEPDHANPSAVEKYSLQVCTAPAGLSQEIQVCVYYFFSGDSVPVSLIFSTSFWSDLCVNIWRFEFNFLAHIIFLVVLMHSTPKLMYITLKMTLSSSYNEEWGTLRDVSLKPVATKSRGIICMRHMYNMWAWCIAVTPFLVFGSYSGGLVQRGCDFQCGALWPSDQRVADGGLHEQKTLWRWSQCSGWPPLRGGRPRWFLLS